MKRTIWTMAATGLIAASMTTCGGGKDYATEICNRLQTCNAFSLAGAGVTTVSECVTTANQQLVHQSSSQRASTNQEMDQCLATSDCTDFTNCIEPLINQGPSVVNTPTPTATDPVAATCNRLQACGALSMTGPTTVSGCTASVNQQLSQVSSSQRPAVVQMLNQCLAQLDCTSFMNCFEAVSTQGPSTVSTTPQTTSPAASMCSRLQACNDLSLVNATTVAQCTTTVNQSLNRLTSSQIATATQMLNQCLAVSACGSYASCLTATGL
jgi:hypothetical protein